jgi:NDP-sugar pyrophosphorylase family protein
MLEPQILILAGGLGTRIRGLFPDVPKPLAPIHNRPFLEWQIDLLTRQGFRQFIFCVGYLGTQIIDYFGDGSKWGIEIKYAIESTPLGTGGAIAHAGEFINGTTIVLNGDTYFDTDYRELIDRHRQLVIHRRAVLSLVAIAKNDTSEYGRVTIDEELKVIEFQEKNPQLGAGLVNSGVYIIEPKILDYILKDTKISLESELLPELIIHNYGLFGIAIDGNFIDMGTPNGYAELTAALGF